MFVRALSSWVGEPVGGLRRLLRDEGFEAADHGVDPVEHGEHVVEGAVGRAGVDLGRSRRAGGRAARSSEPHVGDVAEREHDAVDQVFDDVLRAHVDAGRPVVGEGGSGRGDELRPPRRRTRRIARRPVRSPNSASSMPPRPRWSDPSDAIAVASTGSVPASRAVIFAGSIAKSIFDIARRSVAGPNR